MEKTECSIDFCIFSFVRSNEEKEKRKKEVFYPRTNQFLKKGCLTLSLSLSLSLPHTHTCTHSFSLSSPFRISSFFTIRRERKRARWEWDLEQGRERERKRESLFLFFAEKEESLEFLPFSHLQSIFWGSFRMTREAAAAFRWRSYLSTAEELSTMVYVRSLGIGLASNPGVW